MDTWRRDLRVDEAIPSQQLNILRPLDHCPESGLCFFEVLFLECGGTCDMSPGRGPFGNTGRAGLRSLLWRNTLFPPGSWI